MSGRGVSILLGDLVQTSIIDTESQRAVLLFDEKNRSAGRGVRQSNESSANHVIEIFTENSELVLQHGIYGSVRRSGVGIKVNRMIVRSMGRHNLSFFLGEHISEVVVLRGNDLLQTLQLFIRHRIQRNCRGGNKIFRGSPKGRLAGVRRRLVGEETSLFAA